MPSPHFSIIIPTHGRPKPLQACLRALTRLDYPRDRFEVVVVDDGTPTPLAPLAEPFHEYLRLTFLTQKRAGPAVARNRGVEHARGTFLAFTDDDCTVDASWLRAFEAQFERTPDHLLGGRIVNALPQNMYAEASQQLVSYLYDYFSATDHPARFFTTNNVALRADRFRALGGFDSSFGLAGAEDREFGERWCSHGYHLTYVPEAVVHHAHDLTLRGFWRQHVNYGRGAYRYRQVRARRASGPVKLEPLSFYLNLVGYPLRHLHGRRAYACAALLGMSQLAHTVGFFQEKMAGDARRKHPPAAPKPALSHNSSEA